MRVLIVEDEPYMAEAIRDGLRLEAIAGRPASYVLPFAGDGLVEDLGPDRCSLEVGSWSWITLAASLNRFDTDIEVIHPPELTEAFARLAARNAATAASIGV